MPLTWSALSCTSIYALTLIAILYDLFFIWTHTGQNSIESVLFPHMSEFWSSLYGSLGTYQFYFALYCLYLCIYCEYFHMYMYIDVVFVMYVYIKLVWLSNHSSLSFCMWIQSYLIVNRNFLSSICLFVYLCIYPSTFTCQFAFFLCEHTKFAETPTVHNILSQANVNVLSYQQHNLL